MQYLRFLDFYMSNDPKLELELRKLAEFRLVRFLVARTVRQRTADGPPEAVQNLTEAVPVGLQCKDSTADGPPGYRGQSANGQKGGS